MKIIHTADLHIGQVIYQNYDRTDEHDHFFGQLKTLCVSEKPDALVVSGDVFDIQQPSASTRKSYTDWFVGLHKACPDMRIVITAGNHDSASRLQADSAVWDIANVTIVGVSPAAELLQGADGWQDDYIVRLEAGYIVAMPYMIGERREQIQSILDRVAAENASGKPVVMMGHLAVTGMDPSGHDYEIGNIKTQDISALGSGYDYLALGHIHKPQTLGHQDDCMKDEASYPSGVARYSGSALHVSCDENYSHTLSVVNIARHGGDVAIRQVRIDELRHFYVLPEDGSSFTSSEAALEAVGDFARSRGKGYIRLRMDFAADLPANFNNAVYDILRQYEDEVRFNPKHLWTGVPPKTAEEPRPVFAVADLQQMKDPFDFIEKTGNQYPGLDLDMVRDAFEEVREEMRSLAEEQKKSKAEKAARKAAN